MDQLEKVAGTQIALRHGAPIDVAEYTWYQGDVNDIPLTATEISSWGEVHIGWDVDTRRATYTFIPSEKNKSKLQNRCELR